MLESRHLLIRNLASLVFSLDRKKKSRVTSRLQSTLQTYASYTKLSSAGTEETEKNSPETEILINFTLIRLVANFLFSCILTKQVRWKNCHKLNTITINRGKFIFRKSLLDIIFYLFQDSTTKKFASPQNEIFLICTIIKSFSAVYIQRELHNPKWKHTLMNDIQMQAIHKGIIIDSVILAHSHA